MKFARGIYRTSIKITDEEIALERGGGILKFGEKHGIDVRFGWDAQGNFIVDVEAEGFTSAYCKGLVAEVMEMFKQAFGGKITTIMYVY